MAEVLNRRWEEQEKEAERWECRRAEIEEMMVRLEKGSWAREGAKEDMG